MLVISLVGMGVATTLHGPDAQLRPDRHPRADPADRPAPGAGLRRRRRMGRRHADGRRARPARQAAASSGPSRRWAPPPGSALATIAFFAVSQLDPDAVPGLGLAAAVPVQRRPGRGRPGHPAQHRREPGVREGPRSRVEVKMPIAEAFRRHPQEIFLVAGTYLSQGVFAYICMSYLVSYGTTQVGIPRPQRPHGRLRRRGRRRRAVPGVRLAVRQLGPQDDLPARRGADAGQHHRRRSR